MGECNIGPDIIPGELYTVTHIVEQHSSSLAVYGHDNEGTSVFIKAKTVEGDPNARLRLEREADMLDGFAHPQIPQLLDTNLDSDTPYIVTEFKPGGTRYLEYWFKKYPAAHLAARLCLSTLDPLQYVHDSGITHRDVKTKNLAMQWGGGASLLDFELGLCRDDQTAEAVYVNASHTSAGITDAGYVRGTADYIAPERAFGHIATPQSDIYSMGIVMYELLFGRLPFVGNSPSEVVKQHCHKQIDLSDTGSRHIPDELITIIDRATQKDCSDRYASASEMGDDITQYLQATPA